VYIFFLYCFPCIARSSKCAASVSELGIPENTMKIIEDDIEALFSLILTIRKIIDKYAPPAPPSISPLGDSLHDQHSLQDDDESHGPPPRSKKKEPSSKKSPGLGSGRSKGKGSVDAVSSEQWEPTESESIKRRWKQENHEALESIGAHCGGRDSVENYGPTQVHYRAKKRPLPMEVMKRVGKRVVSASANVKERVRAVLGNADINEFVGRL
jgi:hypothetical protein